MNISLNVYELLKMKHIDDLIGRIEIGFNTTH